MASLQDIFYGRENSVAYNEICAGGIKIIAQDSHKMSKLQLLRERMANPPTDRYPVYKKYITEKSWSANVEQCSQNYSSQNLNSQSAYPELPQNLYDILGLTPSASVAEIRRTYRKLALALHPDKGGDPEAFAKVQEAYEILSDVFLSEIYNNKGYEEVMLYKNNTC